MMRLRLGFLLIALLSGPATTLLAQTDSVEDDAQEYTRTVMQHDELLFKFNMHQAGNDAQKQMAGLEAAGAAIKAKYAAGRVPPASGSAFDKRVRALSSEVIAPARKGWVVDVFPEPAAVAAAYKNKLEGAAAMQVLARTLSDKIGPPLPTAASAKISRYQSAWAKVNPQSRADYTSRLDTIDKLRRSRQFTFEVLRKFIPVYAVEAGNQLGKERYDTAVVSDRERFQAALFFVVALLLAVPFLDLIWGEGRRRKPRAGATGGTTPYQLPEALDYVRVFRKAYPLSYVCGKIESRDSVASGSTQYGDNSGTEGGKSTVSQRSVDYEIGTPDGKTARLRFPKAPVADLPTAAVGELFSAVTYDKTVMLCYNHTKGWFWPNKVGIRKANQMPRVWLWLVSVGIAFVGLMAVERFFIQGTSLDTFRSTPDVRSTMVLTPLFAILYLGVIGLLVKTIRVWQFNRKWPGPLEKFMAEQTATLKRHFGSEDRDRARINKLIEKHRSKS